ncbi:MAG: IgGFc-binding protein [Prevotellaceae bacterium]|jgi:hypothetical protein|nr:IgGFc-binding protein [Prevotellaceae bacterium]
MRTITKFILILVAFLSSNAAFGQGQSTTIGTDFWLGYNDIGTYYELKFVSTSACTVTLTFTDGSVPQRTINITGAGVTGYVFNHTTADGLDEMAAVRNNFGTSNKSVRITSTAPIGVYAINQKSALTDATAVLPVTNYGTKYIAFDGPQGGSHKYIVISPEDGNKVYINGAAVSLNKGQVFGRLYSAERDGDVVTSEKPVAFFVVSHQLRIPTNETNYTDQAFEQLSPVSSWGKEFLVPVTKRKSEFVRVIASMDKTTVSFAGTTYTLNANKHFGLVEINAPTYITADKPIGVCTFMCGSAYKGFYGDPSISWVPSIDQHMKSATIAPFAPLAVPSTSSQLDAHWGQIIVKTAYKDETKVNGVALSGGTWVDGPAESGLSVYDMPFLKENNGWRQSYTFTNDHGLVLLGYGTGSAESYQYVAASSARKLNAYFTINDLHYEDTDLSVPFECGTPLDFKAITEYDMNTTATDGYVRWFIDGVEQAAEKNKTTWTLPYISPGQHEVELWIVDSYNQTEKMKTTLKVECTGISPTPVAIFEGQSVVMTIDLGSRITPVDVVFNLAAAAPSTADPAFYTFPSSVIMLKNTSSITFTVSATDNNILNELDRLLKIKASSSDYPDMFAEITIKDQLIASQRIISLKADPLSINELPGEAPNTSTVTLSLPSGVKSADPIRVNLSYTGSTATYNDDYSLNKTEATSYIDIPAMQNNVTYTITAKKDDLLEGDEKVVVTGIAPTDYAMSTSANTATITIKDKTLADIIVKKLNGDASEPSTNGKFWIGFKDANVRSLQNVVVNYILTGTAKEGTNYESLSPYKATINAGQNGVEVDVKVKDNHIVEGNRLLNIEIVSID